MMGVGFIIIFFSLTISFKYAVYATRPNAESFEVLCIS